MSLCSRKKDVLGVLLFYFMVEMLEIVLYRIYFCQKRSFYGRLEQMIDTKRA